MGTGKIAGLGSHREDPQLAQGLAHAFAAETRRSCGLQAGTKSLPLFLRGEGDHVGFGIFCPLVLRNLQNFYAGESGCDELCQKRPFRQGAGNSFEPVVLVVSLLGRGLLPENDFRAQNAASRLEDTEHLGENLLFFRRQVEDPVAHHPVHGSVG